MKYKLTISFDNLVTLNAVTQALAVVDKAMPAHLRAVGDTVNLADKAKASAEADAADDTPTEAEAEADKAEAAPANGKAAKKTDKVVDIAAEKAERKARKATDKAAKKIDYDDPVNEPMSPQECREKAIDLCRELMESGVPAAATDVRRLRDELGVEKLSHVAPNQAATFLEKAHKLYEKHARFSDKEPA